MKALIDADIIAYACAATAEHDGVDVAINRTNEMVKNILNSTSCTEYELWVSGKGNFRYSIYPEYKSNRTSSRPKWEQDCKSFLVAEWNANRAEGCEADDMVGVRSSLSDCIICHMDKDLDQLPGKHYNWPLWRLGNVIREQRFYDVSPEEAYRNFCYQLVVGDSTDNIKGVVGSGKKAANSILDNFHYTDWFKEIRDLYNNDLELDMNAQCVYIWRKENDNWKTLVNQMGGQTDDFKGLSSVLSELDTDDGQSNT